MTIRTMLVCDDRQEIRDVVRDVLADVPTIQIIGETIDAASCLECVRFLQPDVLLLDYRIPQGGPHVAKAARALNPDMHIIVFSGWNDLSMQRDMLNAGADQYLVKTGRLQPLLDSLDRATADLDRRRADS